MYTTLEKTAVGTAVGKVILIGEHSVVYNKPAIALPCDAVQATVTVSPGERGLYIYCDLYQGLVDDMPELLISLKTLIHATLYYLQEEKTSLHLKINSSIPVERGMGSSAAVSIAIIRALFHYFNQTPTQEELLNLVDISEKIVHGNPSGLDATLIANERALYFRRGQAFEPLAIQASGYLIIADTGITGRTKLAIEAVAKLAKERPDFHAYLLEQLGDLTQEVVECLRRNHMMALGKVLSKAHVALRHLGVSHPVLDHLVETALTNGALGAKMTGGGLGGCMIALTKNDYHAKRIARLLEKNGAKETFIQKLS